MALSKTTRGAPSASDDSAAVSLRDVRFAYPKASAPLLSIPEWHIQRGESVFLQGASGAGKSTLLNIIAGVLPVSAGQVSVLGARFDQLSQRQRDRFRADHMGYIFQQFNLIPYLSALDNVLLAQAFSSKKHPDASTRARELLDRLALPESCWNHAGDQLSIGQQQRVAIARALFHAPALIIADEPTSALDGDNRDAFLDLLMQSCAQEQSALLMVSHDTSLAPRFDRVERLSDINQSVINQNAINQSATAEGPSC